MMNHLLNCPLYLQCFAFLFSSLLVQEEVITKSNQFEHAFDLLS